MEHCLHKLALARCLVVREFEASLANMAVSLNHFPEAHFFLLHRHARPPLYNRKLREQAEQAKA